MLTMRNIKVCNSCLTPTCNDLSCKIACVIGLFDSLINTDGKFDNRKFWDYINVLHNILWRKLQVVKINSNNYFCKL